MNDVIQDSITLTHGKLKRFLLDTHLDKLEEIECRPSHLGQVFTNLLSNAADALSENPSRDGTIRVQSTKHARDGKPGVNITVEDNGPGVPDELRDKILRPFFTTKASGVGTGLGLPICARIIAAHGGHLDIERSEALGGARFVVWLPEHDRQAA